MYNQLNKGEQCVARKLIKAILAEGYNISVHDGEEWVVVDERSFSSVWEGIGNTDIDEIKVLDDTRHCKGWFTLIWGNSPEELVADCSDTVFCDQMIDKATPNC